MDRIKLLETEVKSLAENYDQRWEIDLAVISKVILEVITYARSVEERVETLEEERAVYLEGRG